MTHSSDEHAKEELIGNGHKLKENGIHDCREVKVVIHASTGSNISPPSDTYMKVLLIFLLHGVGVLLPWNVFINAVTYFKDYKLNTSVSDNAEYRTHFLVYIGMASQIPNILLCAVNVFVQSSGDASKQGIRFIISISINIVALIVTIILACVDSYDWPYQFFIVTILTVIVLNSCTGVYQSFIFGLAAMLPMKYSNAIVIGNNLCGTLVALCMIISKAVAGAGESVSGEALKTAAIYYFSFAVLILVACFGTYFVLPHLHFYRYYTHKSSKASKENVLLSTKGDDGDFEDVEVVKEESVISVFRNCFGVCCFCPVRSGMKRCSNYWDKYRQALPYCWVHCVSVFSIFFCTLSAFPALTAGIRPLDPENFWIPPHWFTDVTCFLFFNLFAMIGNLISGVTQKPGPRWLFIPVWIRTFFFIPFFMLCNGVPDIRALPVVFGNEYVYIVGMIIFALTSGYLSSLAMMYASVNAPDHLKSITGMLAAFCLVLGVVSGVQFSLLWTKIVEGFSH